MNLKKFTRNPFVYVLLIGALLLIGMTLISSLTGAKQITTQQGLELLKGGTVTEVQTTDGDQRVDLTLSEPYEGSEQVQFYYVSARADEVVAAINTADPRRDSTTSCRGRAGSMDSSRSCCRSCCSVCCSGS